MAVQNATQYKVTKHAQQRLKERFAIYGNVLQPWIIQFLNTCNYVEKGKEDNTEVLAKDDVTMIVNTKNKTIITCWAEDHENVNMDSGVKVNPELQSFINDSLNKYLHNKLKVLKDNLMEPDKALRSAMKAFKSSPNEEHYSDLVFALNEIDEQIGKYRLQEQEAKNFG